MPRPLSATSMAKKRRPGKPARRQGDLERLVPHAVLDGVVQKIAENLVERQAESDMIAGRSTVDGDLAPVSAT